MPPRRGSKPCHCPTHHGELLSENLWFAHQAALRAAVQEDPPVRSITPQRTSSNQPPSKQLSIHEQMRELTLETPLPNPDVFADDTSAASELEEKRENSRYTTRAASRLLHLLKQSHDIESRLNAVASHEDLDEVEKQMVTLRKDLEGITRRTASLDALRGRVQGGIKVITRKVTEVRSKLEERQTPIPFPSASPPSHYPTLVEMAMAFVLVLAIFFGLSRAACDYTLRVIKLLLRTPMGSTGGRPVIYEESKLLPITMTTVLSRFTDVLSDHHTLFATCPTCSSIYPPNIDSKPTLYPTTCTYRAARTGPRCGATLTEDNKPIRPFILPSLFHYISKLMVHKRTECLIDEACQEALQSGTTPSFIRHPFQAQYMSNFKGPDHSHLFIDGGRTGEARLVFSLNVDWFNVNRSTHGGSSDSTGVMCLSCLNLPQELRYKPEYMFVAIIPGPKQPKKDQFNRFLEPLVEGLRQCWVNGIKLSRTAKYPKGRVVRAILGPIVCDLPAARKVSGLANYNASRKFCSHCNVVRAGMGWSNHPELNPDCPLRGVTHLNVPPLADGEGEGEEAEAEAGSDEAGSEEAESLIYDSGDEALDDSTVIDWSKRDCNVLRTQAFAWKAADTTDRRDKLWAKYGVRYSPLWELPYFNPAEQLVVDPMHTLLEGVIQHHFRVILHLSEEYNIKPGPVLRLPTDVNPEAIPEQFEPGVTPPPTTKSDVEKLMARLIEPIADDEKSRVGLAKSIANYNKPALFFVADKLNLLGAAPPYGGFIKKQLAALIVTWRLDQPSQATRFIPDNLRVLEQVRAAIAETDVPSWFPSVPHDWGSANAGTPKADEWRSMATVYFPIALILAWGAEPVDAEGRHRQQLLELTMCLVQATWLACRRGTSEERRAAILKCLCTYTLNLPSVVKSARYRPNHHVVLHLYDFLRLWGPVYSWWCFPFERLNGMLQRIPTNHIYGKLEITMHDVFSRRANFRRWLSFSDYSEEMQLFSGLFHEFLDTAGWNDNSKFEVDPLEDPNLITLSALAEDHEPTKERAYYRHKGRIYSRQSSHVGNSLIAFDNNGSTRYGCIQHISVSNNIAIFKVKAYLPSSAGSIDNFSKFAPYFPATVVSVEQGPDELIPVPAVKCHCARYQLTSRQILLVELSRVSVDLDKISWRFKDL